MRWWPGRFSSVTDGLSIIVSQIELQIELLIELLIGAGACCVLNLYTLYTTEPCCAARNCK